MYLVLACSSWAHGEEKAQSRATPLRIASINICIDQLLWQLVPHERLVSFSYLTADPLWSPIANELGAMPLNHALAEEIIPQRPDVVLSGEFDARDAIHLLRRLGTRVEQLPLPRNLDDINHQIRQLAHLVDADAAASIMTANITRQLAALDNIKRDPPLTAFWYSANGVVIGAGTLEHELMVRAGLRNLAAERGIEGFVPLDLELLLAAKPQLLIIEQSTTEAFSLARDYLAHPALVHGHFKVVRLPAGLSGCAASVVGDVATVLTQELSR